MQATLTKWGNSLGFRLPAIMTEKFHFKQGSKVTVTQNNDSIIIRPVYDIKAVFEDFYKKPIEKITRKDVEKSNVGQAQEIDWGEVGNEVF